MEILKESEWEGLFSEAIADLAELIRFKTVNPPGNEKPAAEWLAEILRENGLEPRLIEAAPGRANVICRLKGTGEKPPILLDGHLDVVSAEDESKWKYPPFSGQIADGYLWGRGALDMKQTVIANLMAMLALKRAGVKLKRDLILAAVADEEAGCKYGAGFLVDNHPDLIRAEYGLGEIGGFSMEMSGKRFYPIEVAEKAVCWFRIKARGEPGHGSIPSPESSVIKLAQAIRKLGEHKLPYHLTPQVKEFVTGLAANLGGFKGFMLKRLLNPLLADLIIDKVLPDKKLARTFWAVLHNTVNPTVVRAGEKTNVIPSEAMVEVDGRLLPGQTSDDLMNEVKEIIGDGYELETININRIGAMAQDPHDPIFKVFERRLKARDPQAIVIPWLLVGFTDGSYYARLGIKYFGFSPLRLIPGDNFQDGFHGFNERIPIEGYKFGLRVFLETVTELVTEF